MNENTGGPAFPHLRRYVNADTYEVIAEGGMTMRDYFAAKAMAAFIEASSDHSGTHPQNDERVAERAYEMADAMLEAREK